ncbi:MAG: VIT and VWA domain-containing protein [Thermoguttaceae bacterium]
MLCRASRSLAVLFFFLLASALARGQGILVVVDPDQHVRLPRPIIIWPSPPHPHPVPPWTPPPATYKIGQLAVNVRLDDQIARVQVEQSFVNTGSRPLEVSFIFPLPYDGAIDSLTLMVDGKEYPAKLLDAKEARRIYEEIVRKNRDPALLEWIGTGMFQTSVFPVPAGAKRTVSLRYAQLCRKQEGMTDFLFPLSTARYTSGPVEKIDFRVSIESREPLKNVYSPSHAIEIKRPDERHAVVTYSAKDQVPAADFRLFYDVGREKVSTRVLSYRPDKDQDGYFMVLTSPQIKLPGGERPKKTVELVIDRSGSMSGKKIEQVRAALKHVLNNLREGDLFNVIAYDSEVESFRPELQRYDEKARQAALGFVEGIYAGGSTNIDGALRMALGQLQDSNRPSYVIFLTDGIPTTGETNEQKIVAAAKAADKVHARIFAFGVGYDVNARFLDRLVRECYGQSEYVRPEENIEEHIAKLYNRIEAPVLCGVRLRFDMDAKAAEGSPVNRVYPKDSIDLFAGEQLVLVGRYRKAGTAKVVVEGKVGDRQEKFDFPATFVEQSGDESLSFVEKLWAIRRVGEILDELDLKGKNEELVKELVDLAKRHGILTPYTSFMADDGTNIHDLAANASAATWRLDNLSATDGAAGVSQRRFKSGLQQAERGASGAPAAPAAEALAMDRFADEARGTMRLPGKAYGAGGFGGQGPAAAGPADADFGYTVREEAKKAQENVRSIGSRTFFRRDSQWVDSRLSKDQQKNAKRIKQFSDEYFALARQHGRAMSQYMAMDEPVLVELAGQAYLIEP